MNNTHKLSKKTKWIVLFLLILICGLAYWGITKNGENISNLKLEEADKTVLSWFNDIAQPHGFTFSEIKIYKKNNTQYFNATSNDDINQISEGDIFRFFMDLYFPDGYEEYLKSDFEKDRITRKIKLASGEEIEIRYPYSPNVKVKIGENKYGFEDYPSGFGKIAMGLKDLKTDKFLINSTIYEKKPSYSSSSSSYNSSISGGSSSTDNYSHDKFDAMVIAKKIVKNNLKSPSSAKFCGTTEASISCSGNTWTVKGWVDAQNSFGAVIRSNFTVKFTFISSDKYTVDSCSIS